MRLNTKILITLIFVLSSENLLAHTATIESTLNEISQRCNLIKNDSAADNKLKELCEKALAPDRSEGMLQGTRFIGSPVHDDITRRAFEIAENITGTNDATYLALTRGVYWNDDPNVNLWKSKESEKADTWGLVWYVNFLQAQLTVKSREITATDSLLARSHYGDMQFLHAMADKDDINPEITRKLILSWAELMYKINVGEIDIENLLLKDIYLPNIKQLFPGDIDLSHQTFEHLLCSDLCPEDLEFKKGVALGSLLHMIQDSHFSGHTGRINLNEGSDNGAQFKLGSIYQFRSYSKQDSGKHKKADAWPESLNKQSERNSPEQDPINQSAKIIEFAYRSVNGQREPESWGKVKAYLESEVFPLAENTISSGPGDCFDEKLLEDDCDKVIISTGETKKEPSLTVIFEEGDIADNIAHTYLQLAKISLLDSKKFKVRDEFLSSSLVKEKIIPVGYPGKNMDKVLCELNKCKKGRFVYSKGQVINVPHANLQAYTYEVSFYPNQYSSMEKAIAELKKFSKRKNVTKESSEQALENLLVEYKKKYSSLYSSKRLPVAYKFKPIPVKATGYVLNVDVPLPDSSVAIIKEYSPGNIFISKQSKSSMLNSAVAVPAIGQIACPMDEAGWHAYLKRAVNYPDEIPSPEVDEFSMVSVFEENINQNHNDFCNSSNRNAFSLACTLASVICTTIGFSDDDHGTHVSGIIAARKNDFGIFGLSPTSVLLPFDTDEQKMPNRIENAKQQNTSIVNMSLSLNNNVDLIKKRIKNNDQLLFVVSAGNDGDKIDTGCDIYPACFRKTPNVMTVAALNTNSNGLYTDSNYGAEVVSIAAPGEDVYSTLTSGAYGKTSGTSQATAFVSGAAALFKSLYPSYSSVFIKDRLIYTSDLSYKKIDDKVLGGRLDVDKAITLADKDVLNFKGVTGKPPLTGKLKYPGENLYLFHKDVAFDQTHRHIIIPLNQVKRMWWNIESTDWTVIAYHWENPQKQVKLTLQKFSHVRLQPSDGNFIALDDKLVMLSKGVEYPIDLNTISDLVVRTL